ncbi:MAG: hypothetical protein GX817_04730, partial [Elusimicrobia bacterium]|nr:hypothetical protein [Elusimicrobiota bacterium]
IRGIDGYDWLGTPTSELSAASYVLSYTQGKRFTNLLAVGLSLKGILEKLDTESSFGAAVDGGVLLEPSDHIHLAVGFKNLGVSGSFIEENDTLPFTGFAGFGFRINRFMLLAADAYLLNKELRFAGGIETNLFRTLFFRAGWSGLSDIPDSFNFGSGFELKDITLDYAWMPNEELGNTHRIELSYEFGKPSLIEELYRRGRKYFAKAQYDNAFIEFGKVSSLDNNYKHIKSWLEKTQLELRKDPEDSEDP